MTRTYLYNNRNIEIHVVCIRIVLLAYIKQIFEIGNNELVKAPPNANVDNVMPPVV